MTETTCKKPCRECPFRRESWAGYLGEMSHRPEEFIAPHWHAELKLPCHMQVDWSSEESKNQIEAADHCLGFLTMMRNSCKLPKDPNLAALVQSVEPDREQIFAYLPEFLSHHSGDDQ